jgi:20S proteasome alpha/beta subunit
MTIGVGFKCEDGIVLATDTQYTTDGLLKTLGPKLFNVAERPDLAVIIAGAGSVPFMRLAVGQIGAKSKQIPDGTASLPAITTIVEETLLDIFTKHVYTVPGDQPHFELLIGIWTRSEGLNLFQTYLTSLTPVAEYAFVGLGVYVSDYALSLMYRPDITVQEAKFLAAYCVKAAKDYVDACGKETKIQYINNEGRIRRIHAPEIKDSETYCEDLHEALRYLLLGVDLENVPDDSTLDMFVDNVRAAVVAFRDKQRKRKEEMEKRAKRLSSLKAQALLKAQAATFDQR